MADVKRLFNIIVKPTSLIGLVNVSITAKCNDRNVLKLAFNSFTGLDARLSLQYEVHEHHLGPETAHNFADLITVRNG